MILERLEYGKPCVVTNGPVVGAGTTPAEYAELGRSPGFPAAEASGGQGLAWTPSAWGVRDVAIPGVEAALVHAPFVVDVPRRWAGVTLAQRLRPEAADIGGRSYWISRFVAQIADEPLPPSVAFRSATALPLDGLAREDGPRVGPVPVLPGKPDTSWSHAREAAAWILSGVPVVVRIDEQGLAPEQFVALADAVWAHLPPSVRPWFGWAWNVRRTRVRGTDVPFGGRLAFVATDLRVPAAATVDRAGRWTRPTELPPGVRSENELLSPGEGWWRHVERAVAAGRAPDQLDPEAIFGRRSLFALAGGPYGVRTVALTGGGTVPPLRDPQTGAELRWARVDFAVPDYVAALRALGMAAAWEEVAQGFRAWLRTGAPAPWIVPPAEWAPDAVGHGRVLDLVEEGWENEESAGRAVLLQLELTRRARTDGHSIADDCRQRRGLARAANRPYPIPPGVVDLVACLDTEPLDPPRAASAMRAWLALDPSLRRAILPPRGVRTALTDALFRVWDTLAWPWARGRDPGEAVRLFDEAARDPAPEHEGLCAWMEHACIRLVLLDAWAAEAAPDDDGGVLFTVLQDTAAYAAFDRTLRRGTLAGLEALPEDERLACVRLAARLAMVPPEELEAGVLCADRAPSERAAATQAWIWAILLRLPAAGAPFFRLPTEAWHTLLRGAVQAGSAPPRDDAVLGALRSLHAHGTLPPPSLPDADAAIAAVLLRTWDAVRHDLVGRRAHAEEGEALSPALRRFARRWPPGLPELLVGGALVGEGLDGPLPLPRLSVDALEEVVTRLEELADTRGDADVAALADVCWGLLTAAADPPGSRPPVLAGEMPEAGLGALTAMLARGVLPTRVPAPELRRLLQRVLAQMGPDHPVVTALAATWRAGKVLEPGPILLALSWLPASLVGRPPAAAVVRLFTWYRAARTLRGGPDEAMALLPDALARFPEILALVRQATAFSLGPGAWEPGFVGTPVALCFEELRATDLPPSPAATLRKYFDTDFFPLATRLLGSLGGPVPKPVLAELREEGAIALDQQASAFEVRSTVRVLGSEALGNAEKFSLLEENWHALRKRSGRFPVFVPDARLERLLRAGGWLVAAVALLLVGTGTGLAMWRTGTAPYPLDTVALARSIARESGPIVGLGGLVLYGGTQLVRSQSKQYQVIDVNDPRTPRGWLRGHIEMTAAAIRFFDALAEARKRSA